MKLKKNPLLALPVSQSRNDGFSALEQIGDSETRLEALHRQIGLMRLPNKVAMLANALAGELSDSGYLRSPVFELAERLTAKTCDIEAALAALQACEPTGIAARSVSECLALQLKARNRFDSVIQIMLDNLILVATEDLSALAAKTGETEFAVQEMIIEIRALNPRPGAGLGNAPVVDVIPEVEVKPGEMGMWNVALIPEALPKILVDHAYIANVANGGEAVADFTQQSLEAAHWLMKALDQRANTILKVASAIVAHQYAWFTEGDSAMRPLTLAMIAEEIGVHESTVSRVTNGKYLICDRGTFELKYFFVSKISSIDRKSEFSSMEIRSRIKSHIDEENHKKTLSDDRIVNILREDGVDIARRTVAKYREAMSIPSSVQRRKNYLANRPTA